MTFQVRRIVLETHRNAALQISSTRRIRWPLGYGSLRLCLTLYAGIVVDGGRVAEFPAGETIVPSRRASPAAPAASTRTSPPAIPGVANTPPSTPGSEAHVKVLIRRRAEAAVAAARADPTSLSLIRAHNPVLGDAIKAAADERDAALVREGTDGAQQAESGTAMKQLVELIEKEYEAQKKVRCKSV